MASRGVIRPAAGEVGARGGGAHGAVGLGLAHHGVLAGVGGVFHELPHLVGIACVGLVGHGLCAPQLAGRGQRGLVGRQGRAFGHELDAASAARVGGLRHDAVVLPGFGHHLLFVRGVGHEGEEAAVTVGGIVVDVDAELLAGGGHVHVQAVILVAADGVVIVCAVLAVIAALAQHEVVVARGFVVAPRSVGRGCRGCWVDRAVGEGLAHHGVLAGVGGVFHELPHLIGAQGRPGVADGRVAPEQTHLGAIGGILLQSGGALAQQGDAAALAGRRRTRHELIVRPLGGHHLLARLVLDEIVAPGVVAIVEQGGVDAQAGEEVVEVAQVVLRPAHFGDGDEARQGLIFEQPVGRDVLTPERALHAHRFRAHGGAVVVDDLERGVRSRACVVHLAGPRALLAVDVPCGLRRQDGGHAQVLGHVRSVLGSHPAHDGQAVAFEELGVAAAGRDALVPCDELAALGGVFLRGHILRQLMGEVALQAAYVGIAQLLFQGLARGAALPRRRGAFVAADVDVFVGEDLDQLVQHVLAELYGLGVRDVEHVGRHAAVVPHAVGTVGVARKLGIGRDGGAEVAGHLHLGYHLDVALGGIGHDLLHLLYRVVVRPILVGHVVAAVFGVDVPRALARGGHGLQTRILGHLHAPALVVGQVPMETVHLVICHHVEHALYLVDGKEMAGAVEHEAAVGEARTVGDGAGRGGIGRDAGVGFFGHDVARQEHLQRLESIEIACRRGGLDRDAFGSHRELVAFGAIGVVAAVQARHAALGRSGRGQVEPRGRLEGADKAQRLSLQAVGQPLAGHHRTLGKRKLSRRRLIAGRPWNDVLRSRRQTGAQQTASQ